MSKPTIEDTRWAVTAAGVESAETSDPDGDLKDEGYPPTGAASIPSNKDWNWLKRKAHAWFQLLDDLVTTARGLLLPGDLEVGGQSLVFPDRTFTSTGTNDANHVLTMVAHGRRTGDGPFRASNSGGALPGGLAPATDHWWIRLTNDNFLLATNLANALAEVHTAFVNNGSGVHTLADTGATKAIADGTFSRDVVIRRDLQLVGKLRQGIHTLQFPFDKSTDNLAPFKTINAAHAFVMCPFDLPLGVTIDSMRVSVKDNATGAQSLGAELRKWTMALTGEQIPTNNSNGSGAVQTLTTATGLARLVVSGDVWQCNVFYNAGAGTATCTAGVVELDVYVAPL